jgi:hypothetical protein
MQKFGWAGTVALAYGATGIIYGDIGEEGLGTLHSTAKTLAHPCSPTHPPGTALLVKRVYGAVHPKSGQPPGLLERSLPFVPICVTALNGRCARPLPRSARHLQARDQESMLQIGLEFLTLHALRSCHCQIYRHQSTVRVFLNLHRDADSRPNTGRYLPHTVHHLHRGGLQILPHCAFCRRQRRRGTPPPPTPFHSPSIMQLLSLSTFTTKMNRIRVVLFGTHNRTSGHHVGSLVQ